jgi:hypothetical protein
MTTVAQDPIFIGGEWRRGRGADIESRFPLYCDLSGQPHPWAGLSAQGETR